MRQRGDAIMLIVYAVAALAVVTLVGGAVYSYNSAISRAEKAEAERDSIRKEYDEFVDKEFELGLEAEKKVETERKRQQGVSNARIKGLEDRLAATRSQFAGLRGPDAKGSDSRGLPVVPDTARAATDAARDNQLRDVLQHAQEQAHRLIELQRWVAEQGKITP